MMRQTAGHGPRSDDSLGLHVEIALVDVPLPRAEPVLELDVITNRREHQPSAKPQARLKRPVARQNL